MVLEKKGYGWTTFLIVVDSENDRDQHENTVWWLEMGNEKWPPASKS